MIKLLRLSIEFFTQFPIVQIEENFIQIFKRGQKGDPRFAEDWTFS